MTVIAIDFGTSRIKAAYLSKQDGKPRLWMLGPEPRAWIPSLIHMERGQTRLFGDDAEAMLHSDPSGVLNCLKLRLKETRIRLNRDSETPQTLLAQWLTYLRNRAQQEIRDFGGKFPVEVMLTVPAMFLPREREIYERAASEAGFSSVKLVDEPSAAAQAWLAEGDQSEGDVVVLDCGGGTVDWALLRLKDKIFHTDPECVPGGESHLGGEAVNEAVLEQIEKNVPAEHFEAHLQQWRDAARMAKEHVCRTGRNFKARVAGHELSLKAVELNDIVEQSFVNTVVTHFAPFAHKAKTLLRHVPTVLLVGGSGRIPQLQIALKQSLPDFNFVWWEHSEFATVKGALAGRTDSQVIKSPTVGENVPVEDNGQELFQKGLRLFLGEGVVKDKTLAVFLWVKAAEKNHAEAANQIGHCYFRGDEFPKNLKQARKYWEKAALLGNSDAIFSLGMLYISNEDSLSGNVAEASKYWMKAASAGHAKAQYMIGLCYEKGIGLGIRDSGKAIYWYQESAAQGCAKARLKTEQQA